MKLFGTNARKAQASQGQPAAMPAQPSKPKVSLSTIIMLVMFFLGAGIMAYPTFSDWWNSYHQTRAIATYAAAVDETDPEVIEAMLADARAYNERLRQNPNRYVFSEADAQEYTQLLDLTGTGVMGYVQIPSLGINYPIYHGVDESVLQVAIGHIEGTSLPVGGAGTHAAISGHRGLPRARLFTDLDKMREGDTFTITVLTETQAYQVDQIRIVEPTDLSDLNIDEAKDEVTLITCTPYGINTHRLLVRAHRVENIEDSAAIPPGAVQIPSYVAVPAVAVPLLFVYLLGTLVYYRLRRSDYDRDLVMKALDSMKDAPAGEGKAPTGAESESASEGNDDASIEA